MRIVDNEDDMKMRYKIKKWAKKVIDGIS